MPHELSKEQLQRLARLGARARLDELEAERRAILRAFPGLSSAVAGRAAASGDGTEAEATGRKPRRRRRKMAATQRKALSERMKKYWAERRKAQG